MPACARKEIILDGEVGVYHVWTRCVRRSFLCGADELTGRNFDHRRDWIRQYLPRLCGLFAVEAGFQVEMSNHLHRLLRARPDVVDTWSDEDVVKRWKIINRLIHSRDGQTIQPVSQGDIAVELAKPGRIEELRKNLSSVSHFMKALCEHIARRANREDGCQGLFSRVASRPVGSRTRPGYWSHRFEPDAGRRSIDARRIDDLASIGPSGPNW